MDKNNSLALKKESSDPLQIVPRSEELFSGKTVTYTPQMKAKRKRIMVAVTRLCSMLKTSADPQLLTGYADRLEEFDECDLADTFAWAEEDCKFFPSVAELREVASEFERDRRNDMALAKARKAQ